MLRLISNSQGENSVVEELQNKTRSEGVRFLDKVLRIGLP